MTRRLLLEITPSTRDNWDDRVEIMGFRVSPCSPLMRNLLNCANQHDPCIWHTWLSIAYLRYGLNLRESYRRKSIDLQYFSKLKIRLFQPVWLLTKLYLPCYNVCLCHRAMPRITRCCCCTNMLLTVDVSSCIPCWHTNSWNIHKIQNINEH